MLRLKKYVMAGGVIATLAACVSSEANRELVVDGVSITMVQTNVPYQGVVETFFSFSPTAERPLEERVRLARSFAVSKGCSLIDVPLSEVQRLTTRQAPENANLFLIAPVDC